MENFKRDYNAKLDLVNKLMRELNELEDKRIDYCKNKIMDILETHPILDIDLVKNADFYYLDLENYEGITDQILIIALDTHALGNNYDVLSAIREQVEQLEETLTKELVLPLNNSFVFVNVVDKFDCEEETRWASKLF